VGALGIGSCGMLGVFRLIFVLARAMDRLHTRDTLGGMALYR